MKRQEVNRNNEESWVDGEPGTRQYYLEIDGKEASPRDYARVMAAQPYPWTEQEIEAAAAENAPRPFRLWR